MKKVLVTGATGQIGSELVAVLREKTGGAKCDRRRPQEKTGGVY